MASFPEKKRVRSTGHRLQPTPPAAPAGPQPPPLSRPLWICGNQREYSRHAARTSSATHDPDGATVSRPPRRRRSPALLRGRFRTLFFALLAIAALVLGHWEAAVPALMGVALGTYSVQVARTRHLDGVRAERHAHQRGHGGLPVTEHQSGDGEKGEEEGAKAASQKCRAPASARRTAHSGAVRVMRGG